MRRCLTPFLALLALGSAPLRAQNQVTGIRNLAFGIVLAGVPATVLPTDPVRSGQFYVRYVLGGHLQIRFTLPTALNRVGGGATMPITFPANAGVWQQTGAGSTPTGFNPNAATNIKLNSSTDVNLWLGGQVSPAVGQLTGSYQATVTMTVNFL